MSEQINKSAAEELLREINRVEGSTAAELSSSATDSHPDTSNNQTVSGATAPEDSGKKLKVEREVSDLFRWMETLNPQEREQFICLVMRTICAPSVNPFRRLLYSLFKFEKKPGSLCY